MNIFEQDEDFSYFVEISFFFYLVLPFRSNRRYLHVSQKTNEVLFTLIFHHPWLLMHRVCFWSIRGCLKPPAPPSILSHYIYSTTVHTIIYVSNYFSCSISCLFIFTDVYFVILILFLLSMRRSCLCELEAYDTKTNSLYAQVYLAINALSDSDSL